MEAVPLDLEPEPGERIAVQEQAVVEDFPAGPRVQVLPVEKYFAAAVGMRFAPLHAVLDRPSDVEQGAFERLEVAVPILGDERADHAQRAIGPIAKPEDRLERAQEPGVAAFVVTAESRHHLGAGAE